MIRGTTPTVIFTLPFEAEVFETVWITFSQNSREVFTLYSDELILNGDTITAKLTQEQTLKLTGRCKVDIQIRGKTYDGKALASNVMSTWAERILKDGEI